MDMFIFFLNFNLRWGRISYSIVDHSEAFVTTKNDENNYPNLKQKLLWKQQGKSEGFDSYDQPGNLTQIRSKSLIFYAHVTLKFDGWPQKQ